MKSHSIVVVGAGPAGMMASIHASELGASVLLIEKNASCGNKLLLSGKGRCNLTNTCDLPEFLARFSDGGQFLRDAFKKFFHPELMAFFTSRGLALQVERQNRVFPKTHRSSGILSVLLAEIAKNKVTVLSNCSLTNILIADNHVTAVVLSNGQTVPAARVILATGGVSYGATGSTGEGISLARATGHRITDLRAGLVPLVTQETFPGHLRGLVLKNIRITFSDGVRKLVTDIGELLFTDFGISGPLILSHSGRIVDWLKEGKGVTADIDLKPALSQEQLENRIARDIQANAKKGLRNLLKGLLPLSLIDTMIARSRLDPGKKANQLTQKTRLELVRSLKALRLHIVSARPIQQAMVTRGGVSLKDINPRTMESRTVRGLYFAGEMIDVDADTGGFNLQAAFSTGHLAGESAAMSL